MGRFLYFFLYIFFMLPTYVLPFFGSNSGVIHGFLTGFNIEHENMKALTAIHAVSLFILVLLAAARGSANKKSGLFAFPLCAAIFDLLPILSTFIYLVPTILHLFALILGMQEPSKSADERASEADTKKCPHCAEFVKPEAVVCRYCGGQLPSMQVASDLAIAEQYTGASQSQTFQALASAIRTNQKERMGQLIEFDPSLLGARDSEGRNALMMAVDEGRIDLVEMMLGLGADPKATDNFGNSALSRALKKKNKQMICLLQPAGNTMIYENNFTFSKRNKVFALVALGVLFLGFYAYTVFYKVIPLTSSPMSASSKPQDDADYALGKSAYSKGNFETALKAFKNSADRGYAQAQNDLGRMYNEGVGVPKNAVEAARLFRLAADQGYVAAQVNLGASYVQGNGVPKDSQEALKLFHLAAGQGDAPAQHNLGWMYQTGEGVQKNSQEAVKWYRLAADQGLTDAQYGLAWLYRTGEGVSKNPQEAAKWYRLAADQGMSFAQYKLALMYQTGEGVPKNDQEAIRLMHLSADQGTPVAQNSLGDIYKNGQGTSTDISEARRWYGLAAAQGNEAAIASLANLAPADNATNEIRTRFGNLGINEEKILLYKGVPLNPTIAGNSNLALEEQFQIGEKDVLLFEDVGGTACPILHYFVTISSSGAKSTPAFGTCSEESKTTREGPNIKVSMPGFRGPFESAAGQRKAAKEKHVFIFDGDVLSENGSLVK